MRTPHHVRPPLARAVAVARPQPDIGWWRLATVVAAAVAAVWSLAR